MIPQIPEALHGYACFRFAILSKSNPLVTNSSSSESESTLSSRSHASGAHAALKIKAHELQCSAAGLRWQAGICQNLFQAVAIWVNAEVVKIGAFRPTGKRSLKDVALLFFRIAHHITASVSAKTLVVLACSLALALALPPTLALSLSLSLSLAFFLVFCSWPGNQDVHIESFNSPPSARGAFSKSGSPAGKVHLMFRTWIRGVCACVSLSLSLSVISLMSLEAGICKSHI